MILRNTVDISLATGVTLRISHALTKKRAAIELTAILLVLLAAVWLGSKHVIGKSGQGILNGVLIGSLGWLLYRQRSTFSRWGVLPQQPLRGSGPILFPTLLACVAIWIAGWFIGSLGAIESFSWWLSRNWYIDLAQQILLQLIVMPRIETMIRPEGKWNDDPAILAALYSSTIFALLHAPNLALMCLSFFGSIFWCISFRRYQNLWLVWLSHLCLSSATIWCLNGPWLVNLRVGISYILRSF